MNKYQSPILMGFVIGVISVVPVLESFACLLFLPLAAVVSMILDQHAGRLQGKIKISDGVLYGLITGVSAAFFTVAFDTISTMILHTNEMVTAIDMFPEMLKNQPLPESDKVILMDFMSDMRDDIVHNGFSAVYTFFMLVSHFFIYPAFGLGSGLIGSLILTKKSENKVQK